MEYIDPHHKRTDFTSDSFAAVSDGADARIFFAGHGQHAWVALIAGESDLIAEVPESKLSFVLRKIQILEDLKWLTLDFRANPELSRIVIHIDKLDIDSLDLTIHRLIGQRSVHYSRLEV